MDGPNFDQSDSDSGESWTLLDQSPSYADDVPDNFTSPETAGCTADTTEKDEDTDGISIISDSDNEHALLIEHSELESSKLTRPAELHSSSILAEHISTNRKNSYESVRSMDGFLGDSSGKLKTYVHRRNKRLSTVLNIIMLGSVITAAGVAIGHMWGARNDCSLHTTPSVNKILSNLYKLQEENAYLRSKLKEFAALNNIHKKPQKNTVKNNRCKKVFEETLSSKKSDKFVKCLDDSPSDHILDPTLFDSNDYEREYLHDINKLKTVYQQNKSWLDEEIAWRLKEERAAEKRLKNNAKLTKIPEEKKSKRYESLKNKNSVNNNNEDQLKTDYEASPESDSGDSMFQEVNIEITPKKITYADSLKFNNVNKQDTQETHDIKDFEFKPKKKPNKNLEVISEISDMDLQKDDRYNKNKHKLEKKKYDRQKSYKKQKRRNKYEQWEMKGGYMKDYDDISIPSLQDNEYIMRNIDKNVAARDYEKKNYIKQFANNDLNEKEESKTEDIKEIIAKDLDWFEKRSSSRKEARKRLENELFGESSPNNSAWYFRRMARREQCRVKGEKSTYKKMAKRNMNFKVKH